MLRAIHGSRAPQAARSACLPHRLVCQRTHRPYLSDPHTGPAWQDSSICSTASRAARQLYPLKIEADLSGIEGAFTRQTRQRLGALADSWKRGLSISEVAAAASETIAYSENPS